MCDEHRKLDRLQSMMLCCKNERVGELLVSLASRLLSLRYGLALPALSRGCTAELHAQTVPYSFPALLVTCMSGQQDRSFFPITSGKGVAGNIS